MSQPSFPEAPTPRASVTRAAFWPQLLRIGWLLIALGCLGVLVAHAPQVYAAYASFTFDNEVDPTRIRAGLAMIGFPAWLYVLIRFCSQMAVALSFMATGALIFWRRSDDRGALLVSLQLLLFGTLFALPLNYAPLSSWVTLAGELIFTSFFFSCYWFPNGRFVPGWTRWLLVVWIASVVGGAFAPGTWLDVDAWPPLLNIPFFLLLAGSCVGAQVYRYRRVANSVERQQIKWLVAGFAAVIACFILYNQVLLFIPGLAEPGRGAALYDLLGGTLQLLAFMLVPLSIGYAMLRYRLYDVDIVVNRALVYGALTTALALVYVGTVVVLQAIVRGLTGDTRSQLVTVASTLLIAALFQPLRHRFQLVINRRFFRTTYDAQRTLQAFGTRVRDETDLALLSDELVAVARATMQPEHVALWLRAPQQEARR